MRHLLLLSFLMLFILLPLRIQGRFARIDTERVPIARVLKNFEQRLSQDTNNVAALYALARIHSMAYSKNLQVVEVTTNHIGKFITPVFGYPGLDSGVPEQVETRSNLVARAVAKQHLTNAIGYYERASVQVYKGTNATVHQWWILPIHIGLAWCLDQEGRKEDAIKAYRKALRIAWLDEVDNNVSFIDEPEWSWDQIRARKTPLGRSRRGLGPGVCYSEEIIGYLLKLLDPKKDAKEIAQLRKDQSNLASMERAVTPILIALNRNACFEDLVNPSANVSFDLDGTGNVKQWGWITPQAAWLVFDEGNSGSISSGLQMFGSVTFWMFWRDGYAALSSLDDNGDGVLAGAELNGLSLWQDIDGNGVSEAGEVLPLAHWGITELDCNCELHPKGFPYHPRGAKCQDGSVRPTFDWIVPSQSAE